MTDLTQQYAETLWPGQWRIFGLGLRPLSLGHALLLRRLNLSDEDYNEMLQAIWLCHHDWRDAARIAFRPLSMRGRLWVYRHLIWTYLKPDEALAEGVAWNHYLTESWSIPKLRSTERHNESKAPDLLQIKVTLQAELGYSHQEAMDLPVSQAIWECAAHSERNGGCAFVTEYDETLESLAERMKSGDLMPNGDN